MVQAWDLFKATHPYNDHDSSSSSSPCKGNELQLYSKTTHYNGLQAELLIFFNKPKWHKQSCQFSINRAEF